MARTAEEPDVGEVKGLLRRLETTAQGGGAGRGIAPGVAAPPRAAQGFSSAAVLFLIANTAMTTATLTSIAWYLASQKSGGYGAGDRAAAAQPDYPASPRTFAPPVPVPASAPAPAADGSAAANADGKGAAEAAAPAPPASGTQVAAVPAVPETSGAGASPAARIAPPIPATPLDESTQAQHISKARDLLGIGQVSAARLMLQRAAEGGSAEAALLLGDTYDPVRLFRMGARGMVGDTAKAVFWYEKADELGAPEAKARVSALGQR